MPPAWPGKDSFHALRAAPLPARGGLSPLYREKKAECLKLLARWAKPGADLRLETDMQGTYPGSVQPALGRPVARARVDSKAPRKYGSTLFPINHTLAQMRDGLSRLEAHLWVWNAFRNYVRPVTNEAPATSSAQALGPERRPWEVAELLEPKPRFLP